MSTAATCSTTLPKAVFLSHGGGPCFFMDAKGSPFEAMDKNSKVAAEMNNLQHAWPKPEAIVIITAHWEAGPAVRVTGQQQPELLYDYYGFPQHTYELQYPAPGHPQLASEVVALLQQAGVPAELELQRGYDHGVFIPLKVIYPEADIPVVAVSLSSSLDPAVHVQMGKALQGLHKRNVLVVGSGMFTHNLGASRLAKLDTADGTDPRAAEFVAWLKGTLTDSSVAATEREQRLTGWLSAAPHPRFNHPREEHLLPLHVAAGAAGMAPGKQVLDAMFFGHMSMASFAFY